ncbi:hypothetical protein [Aneurinibacillus sp. XH2]|uniref:hypothetical protein n=1 Tax=Aneurinibacillus sp. XH2 TaxID=1450761 RepID=UPI000B87E432|nr:hypothetical protein [Aneurinibacillus sp. XH2]
MNHLVFPFLIVTLNHSKFLLISEMATFILLRFYTNPSTKAARKSALMTTTITSAFFFAVYLGAVGRPIFLSGSAEPQVMKDKEWVFFFNIKWYDYVCSPFLWLFDRTYII